MVIRPTELAADLGDGLLQWLVGQRWFRTKARGVSQVRTLRSAVLVDGESTLVHAMVSVDETDTYQLLLGLRAGVPEHLEHTVIGRVDGLSVYDATQDADLMGTMLDLFLSRGELGGLVFEVEPGVELAPGLRPRPIGVEQSNTSLVYGGHNILKLYRQPEPGPNRDVDLHRALRGSPHIAPPLAVLTDTRGAEPVVLGFMQRFLPDAVEGWATATASVRDLLAEGDLHADEVGGDFAGESGRLGAAVAEVHGALAEATGVREIGRVELAAEVAAMNARLDDVLTQVPALGADEAVLRSAFEELRTLDGPVRVHQIHGDLHLGQVLRTTSGWVLIDFEGEPAATPAARATPRSPLRDVAAMLRSFDYAAFHLLAGDPGDEDRQRAARATEWSDRNRAAFCAGYAEAGGDPMEQAVLLRALELDKAVYEVRYEHHNRPDWVAIPLAAIQRRT